VANVSRRPVHVWSTRLLFDRLLPTMHLNIEVNEYEFLRHVEVEMLLCRFATDLHVYTTRLHNAMLPCETMHCRKDLHGSGILACKQA